MSADVEPPTEVEETAAYDRSGRALPGWVPPDHPLAGTALRPTDPDDDRRSVLELWLPVIAMGMAPVGLFVVWLRTSPTAESVVVGNWAGAGLVVAVVVLVVAGRRL